MTQRRITILLVLVTVGFNSCSFSKGKQLSEAAVAQFHNRYNSGELREIYDQADDGFKKWGDDAKFLEYFEAMRRKLGAVKQANEKGWYVNATTAGTMVTLNYDTDFTEGKGTEQFVFHVSGDKALLYKYNINSPLLITR